MRVVECEVPPASLLDRGWVETAYFRDSYRVPLSRNGLRIVDIFFAVFGHHPLWVKLVLVARNRVARLCGLAAPTTAQMMSTQISATYAVGDNIGVWPIFAMSDDELIAGRDNKHLDFRVSVLREAGAETATVTVSTLCVVHNTAGKVYLFFIVPFHRWGMRHMLARALTEGRL